ncbi:MAG: NAD(+)/NADH kinase [Actinomycetota bacterium]|nr:NAD(+)/NADH kinase [Actinomycetota bacterium]
MAAIAILVNHDRPETAALAAEAGEWLTSQGHAVRLLRLPDTRDEGTAAPANDLPAAALEGADLAVSFGGDGTFLRMAQLAYAARIPVLGVNFGRVGYLLHAEPEQLYDVLRRSIAGEIEVEPRSVLAVTVGGRLTSGATAQLPAPGSPPSGETAREWMAVNEVVVEKTVPGHMVHLATSFDGAPGPTYRADGLLVATPTGSTAYNLSAGGPVVAPGMRAMIVTPVAPHFSIDRSMVLDASQSVTITVTASRPAVLVVDGRSVGRLEPGSEVRCRLADEPLRLVHAGKRNLGELFVRTMSAMGNTTTDPSGGPR